MPRLQSIHGAVFGPRIGAHGTNRRQGYGASGGDRAPSDAARGIRGALLQRQTFEAGGSGAAAASALRLAFGFAHEYSDEVPGSYRPVAVPSASRVEKFPEP